MNKKNRDELTGAEWYCYHDEERERWFALYLWEYRKLKIPYASLSQEQKDAVYAAAKRAFHAGETAPAYSICNTFSHESLSNPRADQAPHDGRCLVLGGGGGVGVGGQGEARITVAQHGGDGFHVHLLRNSTQTAGALWNACA